MPTFCEECLYSDGRIYYKGFDKEYVRCTNKHIQPLIRSVNSFTDVFFRKDYCCNYGKKPMKVKFKRSKK